MSESVAKSPATAETKAETSSWRRKLGIGVWRANQQSEGYLFLLPSLIGFITFVIFPIVASLLLSLYKWDSINATRIYRCRQLCGTSHHRSLDGACVGQYFLLHGDDCAYSAYFWVYLSCGFEYRFTRHGLLSHDLFYARCDQYCGSSHGVPIFAES